MQVTQIEMVRDEVLRQFVEDFGVDRRIGGGLRVDRLEQSVAEVVRPARD